MKIYNFVHSLKNCVPWMYTIVYVESIEVWEIGKKKSSFKFYPVQKKTGKKKDFYSYYLDLPRKLLSKF